MKPERIIINTALCTGCRSCELSCVFQKHKVFGTAAARISVKLNRRTGDMEIVKGPGCDECAGQDIPACVSACTPGALRLKENERSNPCG